MPRCTKSSSSTQREDGQPRSCAQGESSTSLSGLHLFALLVPRFLGSLVPWFLGFLGSLVFLVPWFLALLDTGRLVSNSYLHIGVAANARSGREEEEHGEGARRVGQQPSDGTGPAGSLGQLEER